VIKEAVGWILILSVAALVTAGTASGYLGWGPVFLVLVAFLVVARLGTALANDNDRKWLPSLLMAAFAAKVVGVLVRYFVVTDVYGYGDSYGYHGAALRLVHEWRDFRVPVATGGGSGTRITEVITALLYVPGVSSMLVGFFLFGLLSFLGAICFYLAFRRALPTSGLGTYGFLLFFMPSMLFWPSSIGKDALLLLFIGLGSLGAAYLFEGRYAAGLTLLIPALAGSAAIRPHVAAIVAAPVLLAMVLSKRMGPATRGLGRLVVLAAAVIALVALTSLALDRLKLDLTTDSLDQFLAEQERLTGQGGSAIVGSPVTNPLGLPEATLRVLFRPLPHEAHNPPALLSSLEGAFFLLLVLWRLPNIWFNLKSMRRYPYLFYAVAYTAVFVVAFSSIFNLGILARQRVQVIPLFLTILVGLGWQAVRGPPPARLEPVPALQPVRSPS